MIYLLTFSLSIGACYMGERFERLRRNKKFAPFFYFIAVALLVILAGCRDYTIGTDVRTYGNPLFYAAYRSHNFFRYLTSYTSWSEPAYLLLNFIISRFTASPHWLYAVIALIICLCTFIGIYRMRDRISVTFSWAIFILVFYLTSYNMMRQMMAMAVFFMGCVNLLDRKYVRCIPYIIVGALFHQTLLVFAVACLAIMIGSTIINKKLYRVLVVVGAVVLIFAYVPLLRLLMSHGILADKYTRYELEASGSIALNPLIQRAVPILLFYLFTSKRGNQKDTAGNFLMLMMILDLILVTMGGIYASAMTRIAYYCSMFNLYGYSYYLKKIHPESNKKIVGALLIVMFIGIWFYQVVYVGVNEVYPYTSEILGIG